MKYVNFEIPAPQLSQGLSHLIQAQLIKPETLRGLGINKWDNDEFPQYAFTARNTGAVADWEAFCSLFAQNCVALSDNGQNGKCVGPTPWEFAPDHFQL